MFFWLISVVWSCLPLRVALAIWRLAPAGDLPSMVGVQAVFPPMGKDAPWSREQALAHRMHSALSHTMSDADEKLLRLVEIRKSRFFKGIPCASSAILASTLADLGGRLDDLRVINTALKLRDIVATSFPPFRAADRAFFRAADRALELTLRRLERSKT